MPKLDPRKRELWFLTGSQHLYGDETLKQVADDSRKIAEFLDRSGKLPVRVVWKPTLTGPDEILDTCIEANGAANCVGVVAWMHTFSPAKMWIAGLTDLRKPLAHLHTQFNRDLPWSSIDMDFMNLNQSAHGDREFAFIQTRLRRSRKTVAGHWQDPHVAAAPGQRYPTAGGRRLRFWSGGRLGGRGAGPDPEGDGLGTPGRHVVHGGLHLPSRRSGSRGARGAHARGLPVVRRRTRVVRVS